MQKNIPTQETMLMETFLFYLQCYISRGVISTKDNLYQFLKKRYNKFSEIEKYVQELAWRDYFQLIFEEKDSYKKF